MIEWLKRLLTPEAGDPFGDPERVTLAREALAELAPLLELDGGRIELLGVDHDGFVEVRLRGACASCSASSSTLEGALAPVLAARAPWFRGLRSR